MKKSVLISASCANPESPDVPEVFLLSVIPTLAERVRQLSAAIKQLGVYSVSEFCYDGLWSDCFIDTSEFDESDLTDGCPTMESVEEGECRVELQMLEVQEDGFRFKCIPKHADSSEAMTTRLVPLSFLDDDKAVYLSID